MQSCQLNTFTGFLPLFYRSFTDASTWFYQVCKNSPVFTGFFSEECGQLVNWPSAKGDGADKTCRLNASPLLSTALGLSKFFLFA
jgi:hypothetical protein